MSRGDAPLLVSRPSEGSNEPIAAEEDALLTGEPQQDKKSSPLRTWGVAGLSIWAVLSTIVMVILAVLYHQARVDNDKDDTPQPKGKRNLIFMVSDGMGPTSLSLTRSFRQFRDGLPISDALVLDSHVIGNSRTRSSSSLVTDSAAGATAFSCGKKSYNGAISMLPDHTPCGTVMEAAKAAGYMTGLVVTTRITDATPACFAAHVNMRMEEDRIAEQLLGDYPLGQTVDLMLGGGRCHFLPNTTAGSCRADDKDMIGHAKDKGFQYVHGRSDFDGLKLGSAVNLPLLGFFADEDIPYEIDRRHQEDVYPSLVDMAKTAIKALSDATRDSEQGFFLMIEGSRIDHAGHANDPAAQVHEVLAYDKAFAAVLEFLEDSDTQGVVVSTSDHETGGLSTSRQLNPFNYPEYLWYPEILANASYSSEYVSQRFGEVVEKTQDLTEIQDWVRQAIPKYLGVYDATDAEIELIASKGPVFAPWTFADVISRRSQTGWSTHGHSAADVSIFTSDPKVAKALVGNHENTEVGEFLANYLDVDVDAITAELKAKGTSWDEKDEQGNVVKSWMGAVPHTGERLDGQAHLQHYTGVNKRCELCGH